MALARKEVRITYTVRDEATGQTKKITETMRKDLTKTTTVTKGLIKRMGQIVPATMSVVRVQKSMTQQIKQTAGTLGKFGRRLVFTGFVLRSAFRSISRAMKGLGNAVKNLVIDFSDFEKMSGWLGTALTKLAIGGQLNEEWIGRTITAWDTAMEVSRDLIGEVGKIEVAFFELKTEAAASSLEFVKAVNDEFEKLDWAAVKKGIRAAADAFYDPLITAIEDIIDGETMGTLLANLATLGGLTGEFTAGIVDGLTNIIGWFGEADGEGAMGAAHWVGEVGTQLSALTIPAILIGMGINTLAGAFTVVSGAVVAAGAAIGITGTSGLLLALGAIAIVGATIIDHWEDDFAPALQEFGDAVDGLWSALSGGDETITAWKGIMNLLKDATQPLADLLSGFIEDITKVIDLWTKLAELISGKKGSGGTGGFGGGGAGVRGGDEFVGPPAPPLNDPVRDAFERLQERGGRQFGGPIPKTGLYRLHQGEYVTTRRRANINVGGNDVHVHVMLDGRQISHQVSRVQGRNVRSTLIIP